MLPSLVSLDKQYLWHPFTPYDRWFSPTYEPLVIEKAQGCYLYDSKGKKYWDGNSSIWTTTHGHCHPRIVKAIIECLSQVDHISFLGNTHPWAVKLGQKLVSMVSEDNQTSYRVFFSDNGSTAIEAAIKIAWQALQQRGEKQRNLFLCLKGGYHGDTVGAMSVSSVPFQNRFNELLFDSLDVASPSCFHCPWNRSKREKGKDARLSKECFWECLEELKRIVAENGHRLAAMIVEPKIQGASGMWMHPEGYIKEAFQLVRDAGAFFIVDEVFSGMGRAGSKIAASQKENVNADFICFAKGLSGGTLPIAVTLVKEEIFECFKGGYNEAFLHGHSYTANPVACAAAYENLAIFEEENTFDRIAGLSRDLQSFSQVFWNHPLVGDVRVEGAVLAIELLKDKKCSSLDSHFDRGWAVTERAKAYGLVSRPIKDVLILVPPYCSTRDDIEGMVSALYRALTDVLPPSSSSSF
ncbi:adenosylmethionine--8-amino-7-oxononanoate transaminase [Methylacidiphilum caldifontis]|uniref:adenosylmethionine--8-amino-7-oxononanoate transaminase n=1 Tax=Methylacidiphilum caldifontis TaxID=2795386 RepID=UPI001A8F5846|nr:adenosylmethionine--8-amino-7-oxononanoate transaminase [Methylacidiphilum caldifontis]QSR88694.1 adenosylmethionine--8-amino-7-oxononanoate transaminase [Methylacidiphilum caldifontis]